MIKPHLQKYLVLLLIRIRAVLNPQIEIVVWIPRRHIGWHLVSELLCVGQIGIRSTFMKCALIHFTPLRQELRLPPFVLLVPPGCPLIKIDNPAKCFACVDFTAVQDFGMVEQNITRFYLCWHRVFTFKIDFASVNNLLCFFNAPEMTFRNDPNASVINGRIIKIYVNVEDRVIFSDCVTVAMPSDRRTVFR